MPKHSTPFTKEKLSQICVEGVSQEFSEAWADYVNMRNRIAKTRIETDKSQERIFKQLLSLSSDPLKRLHSLYQSTDMKYRGFFEPQHAYLADYKREKAKKNPEKIPGKIENKEINKKEDTQEQRSQKTRAIVYKQAENGCKYAQRMVERWENPQIAESERYKKEQEHLEKIKKNIKDDKFGNSLRGFATIN